MPGAEEPICELHAHLAGWLDADAVLERVASRTIDWSAYLNAYELAFSEAPEIRRILADHRRGETGAAAAFRRLYTFDEGDGPGFERFQAKFDLVAWSSALGRDDRALSHAAIAELDENLDLVAADCRRQGIGYAELRVMLGQRRGVGLRRAVLVHLLTGCRERSGPELQLRIALSCNRGSAHADWKLIEGLALSELGPWLTAVDFCHVEEGHPPLGELDLSEALHDFNRAHPERALALLIHVGESYRDKSLESAVRWCHQAADPVGAHRLGHCLALGIDPGTLGKHHQRHELVAERLAQIDYDLAHAPGLRDYDVLVDQDSLIMERAELRGDDPRRRLQLRYGRRRLEQVRRRQDYVMAQLRERGTVIECCPTANRRIAGIDGEQHPLQRFREAGLRVAVGADDPGLLATDLRRELAAAAGWCNCTAESLSAPAWDYRSEVLSGREAAVAST